jgi:hypothetical protein
MAAIIGAGPQPSLKRKAFIWPTPCYHCWVNTLNVSGAFIGRGCFTFFGETPLDGVLLVGFPFGKTLFFEAALSPT